MKKTLSLLVFLIVSSYNSFAQVISFELDTMYGFQHDASLTTNQANSNNMLYNGGVLAYKCKFVFDFTHMTVMFTGSAETRTYTIFEVKRYNEKNKTFNASFYAWDTNMNYNVVISPGVEKKDGIVVYIRYLDKYEGKDVVRGRFATNVELK